MSHRQALEDRRYLCTFDSRELPQVFTDVLVIGAGVAGLTAAIEAADYGAVLVLTKAELKESNTYYAQGGIAVALSDEDDCSTHIDDTLRVGQGLCDKGVVELVVREGVERVRELIHWGARFDSDGKQLALGQEGGHSRPRIIHANGDATGQEVERTLEAKARSRANVRLAEHHFVIDILTAEDRACGALVWNERIGKMLVWAQQTILATGGAGQLYRETTNPGVATGDALALGYRAGARLRDLEFVQFHPTTLYVAGASRALISETVRGEGGILRNRWGQQFMIGYHPDAELAARDVVSRAILEEMRRTADTNVYLDLTHMPAEWLVNRFPTIADLCATFGIDPSREMIPVRPSAHYMIGGIEIDKDGGTNLPGLLACGEAASSGLHGANRLGSNSLLEGLVTGRRAGKLAGELALRESPAKPRGLLSYTHEHRDSIRIDLGDVTSSLKSLMWRNVGVQREAERLERAEGRMRFWCRYVMAKEFPQPAGWQLQNMLTASRLIVALAKEREESRGVHFRSDFPQADDEHWLRHLSVTRAASPEKGNGPETKS